MLISISRVHGSVDTVNRICDHPDIKAISFVGGDNAGKHIYERGTMNGKRVQANLGAKNHCVVMPDGECTHHQTGMRWLTLDSQPTETSR
jgi:acyl-CoA reductase-like NAD-dependent aldehyde dehydrogenase